MVAFEEKVVTAMDEEELEEGKGGEQESDEEDESAVVKPGQTIHARRKERSVGSLFRVFKGRMTEWQREVVLYTIYLACFTAGWFLDRPGSAAFFQADNLKHKFLDAREPGIHGRSWQEIRDEEGLWSWIEGPLLQVLYEEDTPMSGVGNLLGYNGIINGVRLRQVRVRSEP
eukprot:CAMPEP_0180176054 /NCGR_PEP_ID=MMETSP0986-20121125/37068_1 /TAXON_ID=697907 /ORGANISM="non described non described, Strain CCMP2293" /LENGTH=171 /DNA_ID=CAMNT_0022128611 /DNA_START=88 /DNA_END=600 /DNA_ORIENTATION=-